MSKNAKIILTIIIVILVIVLCVVFGKKDNSENENINTNTETEEVNNTSVENTVAESNTNTEIKEETIIENVIEVEPQGTIYESNSDIGTTDKKQQAINLVKNTWGEDETVTFRCDSITSDGEYIIAVVSTQTASVKNYFKVNLDKKTVEIDY